MFPPVVKLRLAKVVVSRQYPRKKPVSGMHIRSGIASFGVFSPEKTLWRNIGGVLSLLLLWSLTPLLWSFAGQGQVVVLVRN